MLSEINQTEKDKHHDTTYIQSLKKIETKNSIIEKEIRFVIIKGGSGWGRIKKEKDYITRKYKGKVLQICIKNSLHFKKKCGLLCQNAYVPIKHSKFTIHCVLFSYLK